MTNSTGQGGSVLSLIERKREARIAARALLAAANPASGEAVGGQITAHLALPASAVVAGFYPLRRELDITPLMRAWRAAGRTVALPRTPPRGQPLGFHRWAEEDELVLEPFGTTTSLGPALVPGVLLVPLLAFDRRGYRLGYGGGFYDRTLAALQGACAVGCAYAALELPEVPAGPTDLPLHAIATEHEFIPIKAPPCASFS